MNGLTFSLEAISVLVIIALILLIANSILLIIYVIRFKKYENKYNNIWAEFYNGNLEDNVEKLLNNMKKTQRECKETQMLCSEVDGKITRCIQKLGIVKYDAYEGGKSGVSFALALLDKCNDGVIINSVYNRNFSNIYAKEIKNGIAYGNMAEEEEEALKIALSKKSFM